jgi:hypothetical protein
MTAALTTVKWTVDAYHRMVDAGILADVRAELLWGDVVEMAPEGVIGHSNKEGLMRKPSKPQDHPGKRAGGEHPDEAMSSKRWSTAFLP